MACTGADKASGEDALPHCATNASNCSREQLVGPSVSTSLNCRRLKVTFCFLSFAEFVTCASCLCPLAKDPGSLTADLTFRFACFSGIMAIEHLCHSTVDKYRHVMIRSCRMPWLSLNPAPRSARARAPHVALACLSVWPATLTSGTWSALRMTP